MSDSITVGGDEGEQATDSTPENPSAENVEVTQENCDSLESDNNKNDDELKVVSTASIDLSIAETAKPKEENQEIGVEFEQLDLSPVTQREVVIPNIENSGGLEVKEKKGGRRPPNNHAAESKIAMEIREMRKREEELRLMREKAALETKPQEISNESIQSDGSTKSEDFLEDDAGSANLNFHTKNSMTRAVSLDSLHVGRTYNVGYAFCHRRKDRIKVKPLEDGDETDCPASEYVSLKESPIEREIRRARQREEELKREKGLIPNGHEKEKVIQPQESVRVSESPVAGHDTQRLLATSRIQQEIREQTKREMALRQSGHIQTISQERTDSKVTRIGDTVNGLTPPTDGKQSPISNVEIYEKTNGHVVDGKSPSPTSSTSSANNIPVGRRLSNPPAPGRGVSMQRFIKSKGKDLGFTAFSGCNYYNDGLNSDYYEIRPPQIRKINGHLGPIVNRRSATAESKIQEELKEMKAREDELKRQRARLLGLSQPNLSSLSSDDDLVTNGDAEEAHLDRANSNPNLLDENDNHDSTVSSGRRRSALIAQWEQRIQKAEAKS